MKKFRVTVNGDSYEVEVEEVGGQSTPAVPSQPAAISAPKVAPTSTAGPKPEPKPKPKPAAAQEQKPVSGDGKAVSSPLPGTILDIKVSEGQQVSSGDVLIILEAMKMENEIKADTDGKVVSLNVTKGQSVSTGDTLLTMV